jgi:hypothetical protein
MFAIVYADRTEPTDTHVIGPFDDAQTAVRWADRWLRGINWRLANHRKPSAYAVEQASK